MNRFEPNEPVPPDMQWTPEMLAMNFVVSFLPNFFRELILFVPIGIYFLRGWTTMHATKFILTFTVAGVLSLAMMMFSPEFPERADFPSTIFLPTALAAALKKILPALKNFCRRHVKGATIAATMLATVWSVNVQTRYEIIAAHRDDEVVTVPPLKISPWTKKFLGTRTWDELTLELGGDRNVTFARYHGLKAIALEKRA